MAPRRTKLQQLLAAIILAVSFGAAGAAPALADGWGWRGHERAEHREHEWREREWRAHEWREHHPYGYAYGPGYYAYPYPGYYAPAPVYVPSPSLTVVVPFR